MKRMFAAAASLLLGCSDAPVPAPVRFETAHFRYHADLDRWLCPNLGERLERDYAAESAWLGVELPAGAKVDYHYLRNRNEVAKACGRPHGATPSGCVVGADVYSWLPYHPHELVHAYAELLGNLPPLLFNEGLAVMLGGGNGGPVDRSLPMEDLVESARYSALEEPQFGETYSAAGSFVRHLVDAHGREAYLRLHATLSRDADRAAIDGAFRSTFGKSLADELAAWRGAPDEIEEDIRLHEVECTMPPLDAFDSLPCDAGGALHSLGRIGALEITQPTGLALRVRSPLVTTVRIGACSHRLVPAREMLAYTGSQLGRTRELWTDLPADEYWIAVTADGDEDAPSGDVAFSLRTGPPSFHDACADATAREVGGDVDEVVAVGSLAGATDGDPADGLADVSMRFRLVAPRVTKSTSFTPSDAAEVTLCEAGCPGAPGADCAEHVGGAALNADDVHSLTFAGTPTDAGFRFGLQLLDP